MFDLCECEARLDFFFGSELFLHMSSVVKFVLFRYKNPQNDTMKINLFKTHKDSIDVMLHKLSEFIFIFAIKAFLINYNFLTDCEISVTMTCEVYLKKTVTAGIVTKMINLFNIHPSIILTALFLSESWVSICSSHFVRSGVHPSIHRHNLQGFGGVTPHKILT